MEAEQQTIQPSLVQEQTPQQNNNTAENSTSEFEKEFMTQSTPAVDTPVAPSTPEPKPSGGLFFDIPERPADVKPTPIFVEAAKLEEMTAKATEDAQKAPLDEKGLELQTIALLRAEEWIKSLLLQWYALSPSAKRYEYDPEHFNALVKMLAPHVGTWKIPKGVPEACCILAANMPIFRLAAADRKENLKIRALEERNAELERQNKEMAMDKEVSERVKQAVATQDSKERTRFNIDAKGRYTWDRSGKVYLTGENEHKREMASLEDLEKLITINGASKVQKIFNLSNEQVAQYQS